MLYEIGKRIKTARESAGISAKDLAERIGVSPTRLSNWEQGVNRPMADHIAKIANELDVSTDLLLGITQEAETPEIITLQRGMNKMSPEDRKKLITLARTMFDKAFEDGDDNIDV